jgi:hyaluronoglucosaminidase
MTTVLGPDLALQVGRRLSLFQDVGLDGLGEGAARLRQRFAAFDHPAAHEIVDWLGGLWRVSAEDLVGV